MNSCGRREAGYEETECKTTLCPTLPSHCSSLPAGGLHYFLPTQHKDFKQKYLKDCTWTFRSAGFIGTEASQEKSEEVRVVVMEQSNNPPFYFSKKNPKLCLLTPELHLRWLMFLSISPLFKDHPVSKLL